MFLNSERTFHEMFLKISQGWVLNYCFKKLNVSLLNDQESESTPRQPGYGNIKSFHIVSLFVITMSL